MKKIIKELYPYVIIIIAVVLFRTFIATPVRVDGDSMNSTLKDKEIVILNKLDKSIERFDIVIIDFDGYKLVKRVIALPGESIKYEDNNLYINDKIMEDIRLARTADFNLSEIYDITEIPEDYYFVMGDNRNNSSDSRDYRIGLIHKDEIIGTTSFRIFPLNKIGKFN